MPNDSKPFPTIYLPHGGGPCFFMDWDPPDAWEKMGAWLGQIGASLGRKPKAVIIFSAHWETREFAVTAHAHPPLIYDYFGFPDHTYQIQYPAPGAPALAERVNELLGKAGISSRSVPERGFDHGVFIPFKLIYPDADIPMIQLSLKSGLDPAVHLAAGRALEPLRSEGVLLVGSGMSYHNLRVFGSAAAGPVSEAFDAWLTATACDPDAKARDEKLSRWEEAPSARQAHPREEHLLPLMMVAGAAGKDQGRRIYADNVMTARVSAYQFGT